MLPGRICLHCFLPCHQADWKYIHTWNFFESPPNLRTQVALPMGRKPVSVWFLGFRFFHLRKWIKEIYEIQFILSILREDDVVTKHLVGTNLTPYKSTPQHVSRPHENSLLKISECVLPVGGKVNQWVNPSPGVRLGRNAHFNRRRSWAGSKEYKKWHYLGSKSKQTLTLFFE